LQPGGALAGHDDVGRRYRKAVAGIVAGVADQEDQPPAQGLGPGEARLGQRPADPLALARGLDRERPEQQRRPRTEPDRPVADRAHQHAALARHQTQGVQGRDAVAKMVGALAQPVGAEGPVEQGLDLGPVLGPFVRQFEHGLVQRASGGRATRRSTRRIRRPDG